MFAILGILQIACRNWHKEFWTCFEAKNVETRPEAAQKFLNYATAPGVLCTSRPRNSNGSKAYYARERTRHRHSHSSSRNTASECNWKTRSLAPSRGAIQLRGEVTSSTGGEVKCRNCHFSRETKSCVIRRLFNSGVI